MYAAGAINSVRVRLSSLSLFPIAQNYVILFYTNTVIITKENPTHLTSNSLTNDAIMKFSRTFSGVRHQCDMTNYRWKKKKALVVNASTLPTLALSMATCHWPSHFLYSLCASLCVVTTTVCGDNFDELAFPSHLGSHSQFAHCPPHAVPYCHYINTSLVFRVHPFPTIILYHSPAPKNALFMPSGLACTSKSGPHEKPHFQI